MRTGRKHRAAAPARQPRKDRRPRSAASGHEPAARAADPLERYREKRDFSVTSEPHGHVHEEQPGGRFKERDEEIGAPDEARWSSEPDPNSNSAWVDSVDRSTAQLDPL